MIEHDHDLDILPFWHELIVKKLINKQEISAELHYIGQSLSVQCVVYYIKCDLCDADYVGYNYTARHLHQRIAKQKNSAIGRHFLQAHGSKDVLKEYQFKVSRKCQGKFDCLVYEMLLI